LNPDVKEKGVPMEYTIGNWTIEPQTHDSISNAKNLPIPDLSFSTDYTVAKDGSEEVILINKTGDSLKPVEMIRYTRRRVADVYKSGLSANLDTCGASRANCTEGVSAYAELAYVLKATNSVSGEEVVLPMRGSIAFTVPTVDFVSPAALEALVKRSIATMFTTGAVDGTMATNIARGDLNPVNG
jgi:hypothetical protein